MGIKTIDPLPLADKINSLMENALMRGKMQVSNLFRIVANIVQLKRHFKTTTNNHSSAMV